MNQKDLFNQWKFQCMVIQNMSAIIQNEMALTISEAGKMIDDFQSNFDSEINQLNNLAQEMKQCVWNMAK